MTTATVTVKMEVPVEITRLMWDKAPREKKRSWKDGSRFMLLQQKVGQKARWVPVFWKR